MASQHNDRLQAARLAVESLNTPGTALPRQELAEAVAAHIYRVHGQTVALDANHVGKWERGEIRWPGQRYREALRALFDVATDAELGFTRPGCEGDTDDVDRKTFLTTTLGAGAGMLVAGDAGDVTGALTGSTANYRRMEAAVSSLTLAPAVTAHLDFARNLVTDRFRTSRGWAALAEVAGLAGWLAADQAEHTRARARYAEAAQWSERTGHPLLGAYMTASYGQYAAETGDAAHGLRLLTAAQRQLDRAAPNTAHAWLASLLAVAHATNGDRDEASAALREAERYVRGHSETRWPWVYPFDSTKLARYQFATFARLGDLRQAEEAHRTAAPALTAPKPRALADAERAHLLARAGHAEQAASLATSALRIAREYGSERITNQVRAVRTVLPRRSRASSTLNDALAALYEGDA